ncbi:sensor histidine kinase [Nocardia seriolae]|uniref:histidine kinase n=1 Tax=Nocardia seriolae TaxID=37332 RepID=A0A0B8NL10_9NOCA|nr:sensor histidine kinase [Nocardia seriolae]APA94910.1 Histidine kinase [Nocardia seriolae]MTJ60202.1 sensor histidine kinase [Nocardia seriolae]MTJ72628.1 sensor histidine kinase [Nocardia seriolae]MTJ85197.1 sensor histidine kinase [Nocardia seriolae]MTK29193.1 sensor histidine kinase [Nocardia seriolae]
MTSASSRLRALPGAVGYLLVGGLTGAAALFAVVGLLLVAGLGLVGVGIPAIPEALRLIRPLTEFERRRAGRRLGAPIVVEYRPVTGDLRQRLATVFRDPAVRRDLGWLVVQATTGVVIALFAVGLPLGVLNQLAIPVYWRFVPPDAPVDSFGFVVNSWPLAGWSAAIAIPLAALTLQIPLVARGQALLARTPLGPARGANLEVRVAELTATRAAALDAHGAELRRIERDLHDGAQVRIAAVIMQLGLADQLRERDPAAAGELVRKAQDTAEAALAELRDVVRSVYPPILADRGLASALTALAARSPIPVELELGPTIRRGGESGDDAEFVMARRLPAAVEAAAYFVITEAITNATKHSEAQQVRIRLGGGDASLEVEVRDDGVGGAAEIEGGGLAGMRRRAEALDGRMELSSPAGGPTVVRVELPCGS